MICTGRRPPLCPRSEAGIVHGGTSSPSVAVASSAWRRRTTHCGMTPDPVIATSAARKPSPLPTRETATASTRGGAFLSLPSGQALTLAATRSVSLAAFYGAGRHSPGSDPRSCHCDERSEEAIPPVDQGDCHREYSWRRFPVASLRTGADARSDKIRVISRSERRLRATPVLAVRPGKQSPLPLSNWFLSGSQGLLSLDPARDRRFSRNDRLARNLHPGAVLPGRRRWKAG